MIRLVIYMQTVQFTFFHPHLMLHVFIQTFDVTEKFKI